jgi:hypothetical protein
MKLATNCALDGKKKETPECAVFSYLPFLNHKLGAQMMCLPTCDCLDLGSSEYSNIKYVRKFKVFLKTDQSKSFENSFEQQFNEI